MESFSTVDALIIIGIFITLGLMSGKDRYVGPNGELRDFGKKVLDIN